jgi:predicted alpha-1,6-mannanase (GH76 family)
VRPTAPRSPHSTAPPPRAGTAPKPTDRYYDDNAWIALAYLELHELTGDARDLESAKEAFAFVLSGEDRQAGGGIYWHEYKRQGKHACSCAPAIVAAVKLHRFTGERHFLASAIRLCEWTNATLRDADGLFCDSVRISDGVVNRTKHSYNTALMITANCALHELTGERGYLREAQRIATAALARWVRAADGLIADESKFAHKLLEAFLHVYARDGDPRWLEIAGRCLHSLYHTCRDPHGWYGAAGTRCDPPRWTRCG